MKLMNYRTTVIVLHRPYILRGANAVSLSEEDLWQAESRGKAKIAATNINGVLERLIDKDLVKFLKPMT